MKRNYSKLDIAVIGLSCRFPQSPNAKVFWENLTEGKELIKFYSEKELDEAGLRKDIYQKDNFIAAKALINEADSFDYPFFGYTRAEAQYMDPQIRLLHEQTWLALEDAGINPFHFDKKIGLYLSASDNLNWRAYTMTQPTDQINPFFLRKIANKDFASTLISYSLDLNGPSCMIDTACSSSLFALHTACRSLLMKECSVAVIGGVKIDTSTNKGYFYEEGGIASKDGHCKAFDIESTGAVGGEGLGLVVLKKLEEAIADKDHIYGLIRSSASNNDGNRKVGYAAPGINGQSDCIKQAHQIARVNPKSIAYIETHGSGTRLGDSVEIEALNKAFDYDTKYQCAIGSVKTNMGHLDAAAGVAGLIKGLLIVKNKSIPPSLHFKQANPEINFAAGPFHVNTQLTNWKSKAEEPLRVGVSSFGIGGTNVHALLEEAPMVETETPSRPVQLLTYTAKTEASLNKYQDQLQRFLQENTTINLADLAYTLKVGRQEFVHRNYLLCRNREEALEQLAAMDKDVTASVVADKKRKIVFMFPDQGSQYLEMAKDFYEQETYFKSIVDEGFDYLTDLTGEPYKEIIGYEKSNWPHVNQMNQAVYAQPLLFVIEYALARQLLKWGIRPDYMIGQGLGEYVAACIAEVFSFSDGLNILVKKAKLSTPTAESFAAIWEGIPLAPAKYNIMSKLFGKNLIPETFATPQYWSQVFGQTAHFSKGLDELLQQGDHIFLELGPGKTFASYCEEHTLNEQENHVIQLLDDIKRNVDDGCHMVEALGQIWSLGGKIDWKAYYETERRTKISAPTYCFDNYPLTTRVNPWEAFQKNNEQVDLSTTVDAPKPEVEEKTTASISLERSRFSTDYRAPETEIEQQICNIWESFFGYNKIGIGDSFFELGGDSLRAMSLLKRIQKRYNVTIALKDFYENASIEKMSNEIDLALKLISVQQKGTKRKVIKI